MKNKRGKRKRETEISTLFYNLKSQAAIEFLMTYGWAILLVLIAVGALASFGVLDPLIYFTENKCKIYSGFYCTDFKIDGSKQQVVLVLRNGMGFEARNVTTKINTQDCSGSVTQGATQARNDIAISGSNNIINGGTLYGTTFSESGSGNVHDPAPKQYTESFPQPFNIENYKPGGSAALQAQAEGKYTQITGNFNSPALLNGLYYITGDAQLSASGISGTYTIVAEGLIAISGSNINGVNYVNNLLFFSNKVGNDAIKLAGSTSNFAGTGYFYAPNGEIEISGSNNVVTGGILGSQITISGSGSTITYAPLNSNNITASDIPNPWNNGQTVYLNFTCLGKFQRTFKGTLEIKWRTGYGGEHTTIGIIEGKTEY